MANVKKGDTVMVLAGKDRGKRGTVWRVKYRDASGKQTMETLGPAKSKDRPDGWTKRKAEAALRARLVAVEREGYRRPAPTTFETFVRNTKWLLREQHPGAAWAATAAYSGLAVVVLAWIGLYALCAIKIPRPDDEEPVSHVVRDSDCELAGAAVNV